MKTSAFWFAVLATAFLAVSSAGPAAPTQEELALARRWAAEHLQPIRALPAALPQAAERELTGLVVLANYRPVQKNGRDGQPLRIADQAFTYGLHCHAISKIVVQPDYDAPTQSAMASAISSSWAAVTSPNLRTNRFSEIDLVWMASAQESLLKPFFGEAGSSTNHG